MKHKILKLKKWICKKFGHRFDSVELLMLELMQNCAENKNDFRGKTIPCQRCHVPCSYFQQVGLYENEAEMDLI